MRLSLPARIALFVAILVVMATAALLALRSTRSAQSDSHGPAARTDTARAASSIWHEGSRWTITVLQDAASITPSGAKSIAAIPFRFRVTSAPAKPSGLWMVTVTQDGAEGPFAQGWKLQYAQRGDAMVLRRVAVGDEPALEAELAAIVLGPQFPYETRYTAPPASARVTAAELLERTSLPPTAVPGDAEASTEPQAAPPVGAPNVGPGESPQDLPDM